MKLADFVFFLVIDVDFKPVATNRIVRFDYLVCMLSLFKMIG